MTSDTIAMQSIDASLAIAAYIVAILTPFLTVAGVWAVLRYRLGKVEERTTAIDTKVDGLIPKLARIETMEVRIVGVERAVDRIDRERAEEKREWALWRDRVDDRLAEQTNDLKWIRAQLGDKPPRSR